MKAGQHKDTGLPWRAALLQETLADTSGSGCQGAERDGCSEPVCSLMIPRSSPSPFGLFQGIQVWKPAFFSGKTGEEGGSREHHRGSSFTGCPHSGRNGLRPTLLLHAAYRNAVYSKTLCWLSRQKPPQQVRAALQNLTSIHTHLSNFP